MGKISKNQTTTKHNNMNRFHISWDVFHIMSVFYVMYVCFASYDIIMIMILCGNTT